MLILERIGFIIIFLILAYIGYLFLKSDIKNDRSITFKIKSISFIVQGIVFAILLIYLLFAE